MADVRERWSIDQSLHLALDLCLALGAFVVGVTGTVHSVVSAAMPPDDGARRIDQLARSCLAHPAAHGREMFWNAEVSTEADSADRSLACVVMPIWAAAVQVGLLGIVDTWLPEPDEDQREGLRSLADELAREVPKVFASRGEAPAGSARPPSSAPEPTPLRDVVRDPSFLRSLFDNLPDPAVVSREHGTIVAANDAFVALSGRDSGELAGCDLDAVVVPDVPERDGATSFPGSPIGTRRVVVTPAGDDVVVSAREQRFSDEEGDEWVLTVVRRAPVDVGGATVVQLDAAELIGSLDDGVMCLDATGVVVLGNRVADAMHGLPSGRTLVGSSLPMTSALRTEDGQVLAHDNHPGYRVLRDGSACVAHLTIGEEGEGQRHVEVSARPFSINGIDGALVVMHDATAAWTEQQRLTHYALYDPLTGLANRYLLLEELRRMVQGLARRGGTVALVYLDLDDFKRVNDQHGHDMGDEVLSAVARRLRGAVRSDDVVSRLGGDEFVIAHASAESLPDGDLVVSRLRKVLSAPFRVHGQAFDVGASIGWVSTDKGDIGPDALLARADRAMYRHKRDRATARRSAQ